MRITVTLLHNRGCRIPQWIGFLKLRVTVYGELIGIWSFPCSSCETPNRPANGAAVIYGETLLALDIYSHDNNFVVVARSAVA